MIDEKIILQLRIQDDDNNDIVFTVKPLFEDPGVWGILLVDIIEHVTNAYVALGGQREEILERIKEFFDKEQENSTSEHSGTLLS